MFKNFKRYNFEKKTVYLMIEMYCHSHHNTRKGLCDSCSGLYDYVVMKYDKCPFGQRKPVCSKCKVHCYKKDRREEIRQVMRYAGPRMIFRHPLHTIIYMWHKFIIKAPEKVPSKNTIAENIIKVRDI